MRYLVFILPLLLIACSETAPVESTPVGTAIVDVTIVDAVNGIREHQTVIFEGDEILAVQSADEALNVAQSIDGSGKFLIPGLWDFHVHLTYEDELLTAMPALFLSYGVTSVRDTGGLMRNIKPVVERMRAENAISPRVFFAGPLLDGRDVVYDGDGRPEIGVQNATPESAQAMIESLKADGVDFIKIYEMVTPEVFESMVTTANRLDLPIDSHVPLSMRASIAGPSVDSIEHLRNIEMDCASNAPQLHEERLAALRNPDGISGAELRSSLHTAQRLPAIENYDEARCDQTLDALKDTVQVPTLRLSAFITSPPFRRDDWSDALSRLPATFADKWRSFGEEMTANPPAEIDTRFADWSLFLTGRAHDRGVPIGAGTDAPLGFSVPGYSLHSELEMLVKAGLSPLEALESATVIPARYFSLEDEMGSIDVGKRADMVLLDANLLDDIRNSKTISGVVSKGRYFGMDELRAQLQTGE